MVSHFYFIKLSKILFPIFATSCALTQIYTATYHYIILGNDHQVSFGWFFCVGLITLFISMGYVILTLNIYHPESEQRSL